MDWVEFSGVAFMSSRQTIVGDVRLRVARAPGHHGDRPKPRCCGVLYSRLSLT